MLKASTPVLPGEILDGSFMSVGKLAEFFEEQLSPENCAYA